MEEKVKKENVLIYKIMLQEYNKGPIIRGNDANQPENAFEQFLLTVGELRHTIMT